MLDNIEELLLNEINEKQLISKKKKNGKKKERTVLQIIGKIDLEK